MMIKKLLTKDVKYKSRNVNINFSIGINVAKLMFYEDDGIRPLFLVLRHQDKNSQWGIRVKDLVTVIKKATVALNH